MSFTDRLRTTSAVVIQIAAIVFLVDTGQGVWKTYLDNQKSYKEWIAGEATRKALAPKTILDGCQKVLRRDALLEPCLQGQIDAYQSKSIDDQDLKAQRDMAWFAMLSFYVSLISAAVGAIGLYFLWRSLQQTREAISNDREIGQAQVRAYLNVEVPTQDDLIVRDGVKFDLIIKNTGQSPARNVKHIAGVVVWDKPLKEGDAFPIYVDPSVNSVGTSIEAGGNAAIEANFAANITAADVVENMRTGEKPIYLCAWVFYKDVFDKDRQVWFCAQLEKNGKFKKMVGGSRPLFSWIIARTHNQAD